MSASNKIWVDAVDTGFETLFFISLGILALAIALGGLENEFSLVVTIAAILTVLTTIIRMLIDR